MQKILAKNGKRQRGPRAGINRSIEKSPEVIKITV